MNVRIASVALFALTLFFGVASQAAEDSGSKLGDERVQKWRVGVVINATGAVRNVYATVPIPQEWREQQVEVVEEDVSDSIRRVRYRQLDGAKQMLIEVPQMRGGEIAKAVITFKVTRNSLLEPDDPTTLKKPKRLARDMKKYLGTSPYIDTRHPKIRKAALEAIADKETDWERVEAIYDYVRDNIEYREGKIKSAIEAMRDGVGDCEEMTSLFVAMCRAAKFPARMVWVPDHCYPEFYLEDEDGDGHWIPCQVAGAQREFGSMREPRPILQKGDNFKVPEKKAPQRYVAEFLKALPVRGARSSKPKVEFIREYANQ